MKPVRILADNKSAIMLSKNGGYHARTKNIDTHFCSMRVCVEKGMIPIER